MYKAGPDGRDGSCGSFQGHSVALATMKGAMAVNCGSHGSKYKQLKQYVLTTMKKVQSVTVVEPTGSRQKRDGRFSFLSAEEVVRLETHKSKPRK